MSKALIVIDYTNDFVADDGALTCGEPGQQIEEAITEITAQFIESSDLVVLAVDVHEKEDPHHPETHLFPPHNIRDTKGRELYGKLQHVYEKCQSAENVQYMDKTRYSAFAGTDLDMKLRARGVKEVHLAGVCTDICVLHTAVDAYNLGYSVVVHKQAVASFNQQGHDWALTHFSSVLGAEIK